MGDHLRNQGGLYMEQQRQTAYGWQKPKPFQRQNQPPLRSFLTSSLHHSTLSLSFWMTKQWLPFYLRPKRKLTKTLFYFPPPSPIASFSFSFVWKANPFIVFSIPFKAKDPCMDLWYNKAGVGCRMVRGWLEGKDVTMALAGWRGRWQGLLGAGRLASLWVYSWEARGLALWRGCNGGYVFWLA